MNLGWYVGSYSGGDLHECCYGFIRTGYHQPIYEDVWYAHAFWGLVWRGRYTLGVGKKYTYIYVGK